MTEAPRLTRISDEFVEAITTRLRESKQVRRRLPVWGQVHIDRQLPLLCVYRRPVGRDDAGTERLVMGEASYLLASAEPRLRRGLTKLVEGIATTMGEIFGGFLVIEIWSDSDDDALPPDDEAFPPDEGRRRPHFQIMAPRAAELSSTVEAFETALRRIRLRNRVPEVGTALGVVSPPGLGRLVSSREAHEHGVSLLGLKVRPVYRHGRMGRSQPLVLRAMHRGISRALRQVLFEFTRTNTSRRPPLYQVLGRRVLVKAVWEVDRQLAEVSNGFDFLLGVTPVNTRQAWSAFAGSGFEHEPRFAYRHLPITPAQLKRRLFAIPIERVENPVVAQLFREKQNELDRQLTALTDRDTPSFLYSSLQLFGGVDAQQMGLAEEVLDKISAHSREDSGRKTFDAFQFAERAEKEIEYFREGFPEVSARVELRDDISALMVSRGNLLVPREIKIPASRVEALIQHEVGTHVLTYFNGRAQPFRQLYAGLAGYEELQEGLAVLSEYLVGGLSRPRLRLLAARVLAVKRLMDGASFMETFREIDRNYEFNRYTAYTVTMRVYRAGGLTKDATYFKGLLRLLEYLRQGGALDALFIGKISARHLPIMEELLARRVLRPPPLKPRYMSDPQTVKRIGRLHQGVSLFDLISPKN